MGTQSNVIVGLGSGFVKIGAYDAAEGSCVDVGYTEGGAELNVDRKYTEVTVDQELGPIDAVKIAERAILKLTIAEATLANLAIALDYPSGAVASSVLSIGGDDTVTKRTIFMNVKGPTSGTRKYKFHKCVVISGGKHKYSRNGVTVVDVEVLILQDTTKTADGQLFTVTDASADTTAPTVVITTPASGGTVVKDTKGTVVLTITETNQMNENSIVYGDTVQIVNITTTSAPTLVAGTIAYDATAKTITFTPTSNWTASDDLMVVVSKGLQDNAGNNLATTYVDDFTVTA